MTVRARLLLHPNPAAFSPARCVSTAGESRAGAPHGGCWAPGRLSGRLDRSATEATNVGQNHKQVAMAGRLAKLPSRRSVTMETAREIYLIRDILPTIQVRVGAQVYFSCKYGILRAVLFVSFLKIY